MVGEGDKRRFSGGGRERERDRKNQKENDRSGVRTVLKHLMILQLHRLLR